MHMYIIYMYVWEYMHTYLYDMTYPFVESASSVYATCLTSISVCIHTYIYLWFCFYIQFLVTIFVTRVTRDCAPNIRNYHKPLLSETATHQCATSIKLSHKACGNFIYTAHELIIWIFGALTFESWSTFIYA